MKVRWTQEKISIFLILKAAKLDNSPSRKLNKKISAKVCMLAL